MSKPEEITLGIITLHDGEKLPLRMPIMVDVVPLFMGSGKNVIEIVVTACTGKSWEWFLDLSLADGAIVLNGILPAVKAVTELFNALNPEMKQTKH